MGFLNWMRGLMGRKIYAGTQKPLPPVVEENVKRQMETVAKQCALHGYDDLFSLFHRRYRTPERRRKVVRLGEFIAECPGRRHAWFASNVGPVRKRVKFFEGEWYAV